MEKTRFSLESTTSYEISPTYKNFIHSVSVIEKSPILKTIIFAKTTVSIFDLSGKTGSKDSSFYRHQSLVHRTPDHTFILILKVEIIGDTSIMTLQNKIIKELHIVLSKLYFTEKYKHVFLKVLKLLISGIGITPFNIHGIITKVQFFLFDLSLSFIRELKPFHGSVTFSVSILTSDQ